MLDLLYDSDDGSRVMTPCAAVVPEAPSDFVQNPAHAGGLSEKDTVGERAQKQDYRIPRKGEPGCVNDELPQGMVSLSSRTPERKQRKKEKRQEGTSPSVMKWNALGAGHFKHLGLQSQRERVEVRCDYSRAVDTCL